MSNVTLSSELIQKPISLSVESSRTLCDEHYYCVDKALLVRETLDAKDMTLLFTRPKNGDGSS